VLPQTVAEGKAYMSKLGVEVDEVVQAPLNSIDVSGTPTLMLVNSNGTVIDRWIGRLPAEKEAAVLNNLRAANNN
jgi:hypothetical protein